MIIFEMILMEIMFLKALRGQICRNKVREAESLVYVVQRMKIRPLLRPLRVQVIRTESVRTVTRQAATARHGRVHITFNRSPQTFLKKTGTRNVVPKDACFQLARCV